MRRIVYGEDERLLRWAEDRGASTGFPNDAKAIGMEIDGEIVGAFCFHQFSERGCLMSVASDQSWDLARPWLTRELLVRSFAYPFLQCGKARVTALVSERNTASLRFVQRLGAKLEGRLREEGLEGEDLLVFGLLRRECRWVIRALASRRA